MAAPDDATTALLTEHLGYTPIVSDISAYIGFANNLTGLNRHYSTTSSTL
jgi:hypothetical protein